MTTILGFGAAILGIAAALLGMSLLRGIHLIKQVKEQTSVIITVVVILLCIGGFIAIVAVLDDRTDARTAHQTALVQPMADVLISQGFEPPSGQNFREPTWYIFNQPETAARTQIRLASGAAGEIHLRRTMNGWESGCFTPNGFQKVINGDGVTFLKSTKGCEGLELQPPD